MSELGDGPATNRERYEAETSAPACIGCHTGIDGIGFSFEHYDSLGMWRDEDNGYAVDASGVLTGTDVDGDISDAVELAHRLASSRTVHDCHTREWLSFALGRNLGPADAAALEELQEGFWQSEGTIQELLVTISSSPLFRLLEGTP